MKKAVIGRIQTGTYTNMGSQKVYTTDVIVDKQEFVESKGAAGGKPESTPDGFDPVGDIPEDLPFN